MVVPIVEGGALGQRERLDVGLDGGGGGGGQNVVKSAMLCQLESGLVARCRALRCGYSALGHPW